MAVSEGLGCEAGTPRWRAAGSHVDHVAAPALTGAYHGTPGQEAPPCERLWGGGLHLTELKSDKSRRTIALPRPLVAALKTHRAAQLHERMTAGPAWHDGGFVWCQPNGRPIGNHADWDEWRTLLKATGIRQVRVHDARHTAATLLLAQGVDQRIVMEILGHSQISMTSRYAHVLPQVMTDAAERIGRALWGET